MEHARETAGKLDIVLRTARDDQVKGYETSATNGNAAARKGERDGLIGSLNSAFTLSFVFNRMFGLGLGSPRSC